MIFIRPNLRVGFDASNPYHVESYVSFVTVGKFIQLFELESPYEDVPTMIRSKLVEYAIWKATGKKIEDPMILEHRLNQLDQMIEFVTGTC